MSHSSTTDQGLQDAFPGWALEIFSDTQDHPKSSEQDSLGEAKTKKRGHGGARQNSGRKRQGIAAYRKFMDEEIALADGHVTEPKSADELKALRIAQAAHARKEKAKLQLARATQCDQDRAVVAISTLAKHANAREVALSVMTPLQQLLLVTAETVRETCVPDTGSSTGTCLLTQRLPVSSLANAASNLGVAPSTLKRNVQHAASSLINCASLELAALTDWLHRLEQDESYRLLLVLKKRQYDETPSKIAVDIADSASKTTGMAKVMQTRFSLTFLLQHRQTGTYMRLRTNVPTWLQAVDRTTAECIKATQDAIESVVPDLHRLACLHETSVSLVNTDRYAANYKAERAKATERPQWTQSHYPCDVHRCATALKFAFSKVDGHVTGMISGALAMTEAGSTHVLRECMAQVLEDRLVVRLGEPTEDNVRHTIHVLNLFLPLPKAERSTVQRAGKKHIRRWQQQRAVLLFFLNGDISKPNVVEFYTSNWDLSHETVLRAMQRFLVPALIPCKPPLFSRKSWTGGDGVAAYYGLLCSFHSLLLPTMQLFTRQSAAPEQPLSMDAAQGGQEPQPLQLPQETTGSTEQDLDADFPSNAITAETVASGEIDWQHLNRCMRARLCRWVSLDPGEALIVIQLATLACFKLLYALLDQGSRAYETRQRVSCLKTGTRRYRVQDAAHGLLLDEFFASVWQDFQLSPTGAGAFAKSSCSWEMQCLHFRMLASVACSVEESIGRSWSSYPVKMFKMLSGEHKDLFTDPPCLLEPLSVKMKECAEKLSKPDFEEILAAIAHEFTLDISEIEARHASTRRILHVRNVQVSLPTLEDVGAAWVLRGNVIDREENLTAEKANPEGQDKTQGSSRKTNSARKVAPWNVFVREYFSSKALVGTRWSQDLFRDVSDKWKQVPYEQKAKMESEAFEANLRKSRGFPAFDTNKGKLTDKGRGQIVPRFEPEDLQGQLQHSLRQIALNNLMDSRSRSANESSNMAELSRHKHSESEVGLYREVLGIVPDMIQCLHAFPANHPSADLHLPADLLAQDCRV